LLFFLSLLYLSLITTLSSSPPLPPYPPPYLWIKEGLTHKVSPYDPPKVGRERRDYLKRRRGSRDINPMYDI